MAFLSLSAWNGGLFEPHHGCGDEFDRFQSKIGRVGKPGGTDPARDLRTEAVVDLAKRSVNERRAGLPARFELPERQQLPVRFSDFAAARDRLERANQSPMAPRGRGDHEATRRSFVG